MSRGTPSAAPWVALALLLCAAGARSAEPQKKLPKSTSNVKPGTTVVWDPDQGGWQSPLPFDVFFYASIPIDGEVQKVEGRFVGDTSPLFCAEVFPQFRQYVDYGFGLEPLVASEQRQIQRMSVWKRDEREAAEDGQENAPQPPETAALKIKKLLPNRYYCFEFTKTRSLDTEAAAFQERLARQVDLALRQWQHVTSADAFPPQAYGELRDAVIHAVEAELGPNERLIVKSGRFLDVTTTTMDLGTSEKVSFNGLLEAQSQRQDRMDSLQEKLGSKNIELLSAVFDSPGLLALKNSATSERLKNLLAWIELEPTRGELAEIADGTIDLEGALAEQRGEVEASANRAAPWSEIWSPEDLAVRKRNLESTLGSLEALAMATRAATASGASDGQDAASQTIGAENAQSLLTALGRAGTRPFQGVIGYVDFLLASNFESVNEILEKRSRTAARLVEHITRVEIERLLIEGSTTADYKTQSNWYLGFDLGIAWAQDIEDFFGYLGTNISFRPINKEAELSWSEFQRGQRMSELLRRLSITVGVTIADLEEEVGPEGQFQPPSQGTLTQGLIGDRQLVFGVGLRLSKYMRLSGGALVFKDKDPNPLIDRSRLAWSPLLSVSIDFDIVGGLQNRFNPQP